MRQIKINTLSNLVGRMWMLLMGLIFIPVYIKFLGIEVYGLIGFFVVIQSLSNLLDLGIGLTLNREISMLSAGEAKNADKESDLLKTLEIIYWAIACAAGVVVIVISGSIARYWINPQNISRDMVENAVRLMGLAVIMQFPFNFYQAGLTGLEKQVLVNVILIVVTTARTAGAAAALYFSPTIYRFFLWQVAVSLVATIVTGFFLWRSLPKSSRAPRFRYSMLKGVWRFSAVVSANMIIGAFLTQLDKIVLSKILPLKIFGYYMLGVAAAYSLWSIIVPVNTALFPQFARLVAKGDQAELRSLYHKASQFMAALLLPAAFLLIFFSRKILMLWTGNPAIADNACIIVSLLSIGIVMNGLVNVPTSLQLAFGWPELMMYTNLIMAVALVPLMVILAVKFGVVGASCVWVILNSGYILLMVPIMHRRLLKEEQKNWYLKDTALPLAGAVLAGFLARLAMPADIGFMGAIVYLGFAWILMTVTVSLLAREVRLWAFNCFRKLANGDYLRSGF